MQCHENISILLRSILVSDWRSADWTRPVKDTADQRKSAFIIRTTNCLNGEDRLPFDIINSDLTFVNTIRTVLRSVEEFAQPL